jgi:hypothetical protein
MSLSANRIPPSGQARGHASPGHALMDRLAALQKPTPGGFMLLEQVKPAALLRTEPVLRRILQLPSRPDDGIETDEFLGFFGRQADHNSITERIDRKAVVIIGHDGQLTWVAKFVNAIPDLT